MTLHCTIALRKRCCKYFSMQWGHEKYSAPISSYFYEPKRLQGGNFDFEMTKISCIFSLCAGSIYHSIFCPFSIQIDCKHNSPLSSLILVITMQNMFGYMTNCVIYLELRLSSFLPSSSRGFNA